MLGLLVGLVLLRRGNLAWDDADYLRRGLANARLALEAGPLGALPQTIRGLLLEQPKPPWLVAWIEFSAHLTGRKNIDLLILFSSVVPYAFLMTAVIYFGRRLHGPWGGLVALFCLAASPLSLAFGGKVMVETSLALWVLCIYGLTAFYLAIPNRAKAVALGLAVGLALLSKLTIVLFLPGPMLYAGAAVVRSGGDRVLFLKRLMLSVAVCMAVAGPWYLKNASSAVNFAIFSAKYNELATGVLRTPLSQRAAEMANNLAGWPLIVTLAACAVATVLFRAAGSRHDDAGGDQATAAVAFRRMAALGAGIAAAILLYPTYFDTRFLLPIWPVVAVAISSWLCVQVTRIPFVSRSILGLGLAVSVACAGATAAGGSAFPTYWKTTALIDDLVIRYGVRTLVNVGNCPGWNVCKTGLMNELREDPESCFVLHDLTRASGPRADRLLNRADAVVVLGRSDLSDAALQISPGLNRGYLALLERLNDDSSFSRVTMPATDGLPELLVYLRPSRIAQNREKLKSDTRRRR